MSSTTLTPNQDRLFRQMRELNFGTVRDLHVRDGDPQFDPPPRLTKSVRLPETAPPKAATAAYELNRLQALFLRNLDAVGDGVVGLIKVHNGLPSVMEVPVAV